MAKTFEERSYAQPDNLLERRFLKPWEGVNEDLDRIYSRGEITVGSPQLSQDLFTQLLTDQSRTIIFGGQLGDEGKGRLVDNEITAMLQIPKVKTVNVIRYQGGNNAGHTVEKNLDNGKKVKLALHQVPSAVMYTEAVGIMDTGMVINVEDLQTEVGYVEAEESIGDIRGKLYLSKNAIHNTDLDRVTEYTNRLLTNKASGGTSRGIGPSYAGHYDRTGSRIHEFMGENWREEYGNRYDLLQQTLAARGMDLATVEVPDFKATVETTKAQKRTVGTREEFLDRLDASRSWLESRDMIRDTVTIHEETIADMSKGVIFEGSQAVGLHPWLGTYPDVTASDTTASGVRDGTAFWMDDQAQKRIAIIKHNPSSVGDRRMPTHIDLPKDSNTIALDATLEQQNAARVREVASERGTTTGRYRDMNHLDLSFLIHNLRFGKANSIGVTHLDVAWEDTPVRVATHYTDKAGNPIRYRPDLHALQDVVPQYVDLPGWDGEAASRAKSFDDLPENAKKYLAFIQARTGVPIIAVTTGSDRESFIEFPGSKPQRRSRRRAA